MGRLPLGRVPAHRRARLVPTTPAHVWEQDRQREREARARGDDFRRYTWDDVFEHPRLMMRELTAFFGASRPAITGKVSR